MMRVPSMTNIENKADKFVSDSLIATGIGALKIGDDLSGCTMAFPETLDYTCSIDNADGSVIRFANLGHITIYHEVGKQYPAMMIGSNPADPGEGVYYPDDGRQMNSYTFPDNSVVSAFEGNNIYDGTAGTWAEQINVNIMGEKTYNLIDVYNAINGFVAEDEITQIIANLNTSLTKNASELSQGERNTVLEMVNNAIADTGNSITAEQVQQMINAALLNVETPLTEEQIIAIVNESIANVGTITLVPNYNAASILASNASGSVINSGFFPSGTFSGSKNGTTITAPDDGVVIISGLYKYSKAENGSIDLYVQGALLQRVYQDGSTSMSLDYTSLQVSAGNSIYLRIGNNTSGTTYSGQNCLVRFYSMKQSSTPNPNYQDLSLFATSAVVQNEAILPLGDHKATDRFRWQDAYDGERESIIRDAANTGLKPDEASIVEVPAPTAPMPINDEAGGVIGVTMRNVDGAYCTVAINGTQSTTYSSDGLADNVPVTKYFWLHPGDTIVSVNAESYNYTPFVADPSSAMYILRKQLEQTQNDLAALKANVEGKVLDDAALVDIEGQQPYTVTEALGGVVKYTGVNVLLTTWALEVNGTAVRNGSLLGLGTEQGEYAVKNGDVITSIGMSVLTFTPYKLGA